MNGRSLATPSQRSQSNPSGTGSVLSGFGLVSPHDLPLHEWTSATATSLRFLLAVGELMSAPAIPSAPKLACKTVSLGAAWACSRQTNGAASVAAVLRAVRRVTRAIGKAPGGWEAVEA